MKSFSWSRFGRRVLPFAAGFFSASAIADLPGGEYACQVVAEGGSIGIVLVQADEKQVARQAALGASAYVDKRTRAQAASVVECISRPDEKFSDYQAQQLFESMPK